MKLIQVQYIVESEEMIPVHSLDLQPEILEEFCDMGVIEVSEDKIQMKDIRRLFRALRLKNCLGIDLTGTAVILDLLDRIEDLEEEVRFLKQKK